MCVRCFVRGSQCRAHVLKRTCCRRFVGLFHRISLLPNRCGTQVSRGQELLGVRLKREGGNWLVSVAEWAKWTPARSISAKACGAQLLDNGSYPHPCLFRFGQPSYQRVAVYRCRVMHIHDRRLAVVLVKLLMYSVIQ